MCMEQNETFEDNHKLLFFLWQAGFAVGGEQRIETAGFGDDHRHEE